MPQSYRTKSLVNNSLEDFFDAVLKGWNSNHSRTFSQPLAHYLLPSLLLQMTGFIEQKYDTILWEIGYNQHLQRYSVFRTYQLVGIDIDLYDTLYKQLLNHTKVTRYTKAKEIKEKSMKIKELKLGVEELKLGIEHIKVKALQEEKKSLLKTEEDLKKTEEDLKKAEETLKKAEETLKKAEETLKTTTSQQEERTLKKELPKTLDFYHQIANEYADISETIIERIHKNKIFPEISFLVNLHTRYFYRIELPYFNISKNQKQSTAEKFFNEYITEIQNVMLQSIKKDVDTRTYSGHCEFIQPCIQYTKKLVESMISNTINKRNTIAHFYDFYSISNIMSLYTPELKTFNYIDGYCILIALDKVLTNAFNEYAEYHKIYR